MKQNLLVVVVFALATLDAPRRCGRAQRHAGNIIGRLVVENTFGTGTATVTLLQTAQVKINHSALQRGFWIR
jgi:hypothetical protein